MQPAAPPQRRFGAAEQLTTKPLKRGKKAHLRSKVALSNFFKFCKSDLFPLSAQEISEMFS